MVEKTVVLEMKMGFETWAELALFFPSFFFFFFFLFLD